MAVRQKCCEQYWTSPGGNTWQNSSYTATYHLSRKLSCGGARGVVVIVVGNGHGDTSSNPETDCISHSTNTLGEGMNPIILPPAIGK